jgi:hypothetical protein
MERMTTDAWEQQWKRVQADSQTHTHYLLHSRSYPRVPCEQEVCGDCGVSRGQLHVVGNTVTAGSPPRGYPLCDQERCPACRGQALSCPCQLAPGKRTA